MMRDFHGRTAVVVAMFAWGCHRPAASTDPPAAAAPSASPSAAPSANPTASAAVTPEPEKTTDVVEYNVILHVDPKTKTVQGKERVTVLMSKVTDRHSTLYLRGLAHDAFKANCDVTGRDEGDAFVVTFPATRGLCDVEIDYHGTARGVVFGDGFFYTGFETSSWMLASEEPDDEATFQLRLMAPAGYLAVATGRATGPKLTATDPTSQEWVFDEQTPFSPYLFGFAAGKFTDTKVTDPVLDLRVLGAGETAASLQKKFAPTAEMYAFLAERAGIVLSTERYTQVLVRGSEAQEKSTFSIIGTEELDTILKDPTEDWAIVHELSHQFWGNAVTCASWSEFWLNEGFATFMTAAYKQKKWGDAAYAHELDLLRQRRQTAIDARFDVPLAFEGKYPNLAVRRAVQYSKGALFLDTLRRELGEEAFWKGIREYTRTGYQTRLVKSRDLQVAMEAASGRVLDGLFTEWVYGVRSAPK